MGLITRRRSGGSVRRGSKVAVLALAALLTLPAGLALGGEVGGVPVDDPRFADFERLLDVLGVDQAGLELAAGAAMVPADPRYFHPVFDGGSAEPPQAAIDLTLTAEVNFTNIAQYTVEGGPLSPEAAPLGPVLFGRGLDELEDGEFYVGLLRVGERIAESNATQEFATAMFDSTPLGGGPAVGYDPGQITRDLFAGMNTVYLVHAEPNQPFVLDRLQFDPNAPANQSQFMVTDTNAFAVISGNTVVMFVPEDEFDGVIDLRFLAFYAQRGQVFDPDLAAAQAYPYITDEALTIDGATLPMISIGGTVPTAAPITPAPITPAPPTATPAPPTATPTATPAPTPVPGPTTATGAGLDPLMLLGILGLALILLALLLWWLRRRAGGGVMLAQTPVVAVDPCEEIRRAYQAALADCERARREAAEARRRADDAQARSEEAKKAAAEKRAERDRLERLVDELSKPADESRKLGESEGKTVSEYDLQLQNEALAQAQADYQAAQAAAQAAGADAAAMGDLAQQFSDASADLMGYEGLERLRERDKQNRGRRLEEARTQLDAARAAAEAAETEARTASEAADAAEKAAADAKKQADAICARADDLARRNADCIKREEEKKAAAQPTPAPTGTGDDAGTGTTPTGGTTPGGTPPKTTGGGSTPPPPSKPECPPPNEQWRRVGKRLSFTVPAPNARINISSEPQIPALVEWINGQAYPATGDDTSVSSKQWDRLDQSRFSQIFGTLEAVARQRTMSFTVTTSVRAVSVQCEHHYVCQNGRLVAANEGRADVSEGEEATKTWQQSFTAPSLNEVWKWLQTVKREVDALRKADDDFESAQRSCSRGGKPGVL